MKGPAALQPVRKLRFDEGTFAPRRGEDMSFIAAALHTPDGTAFVSEVAEMIESGKTPEGDWVGLLRDSRGQFEKGQRTLIPMLQSCRGLWVTDADLKHELKKQGFDLPVALVPPLDCERDPQAFISELANSSVYRALPTPASQSADLFRKLDLTVMLCSYKRVQNIGPILDAFCGQTYTGSIEVIIWNNNPDAAIALEDAVAPFRERLDITLLHSSRNFYCIVRLAVAHLMRGEQLMICDDDVKPGPRFLEIFTGGLQEAGGKSVVCARGNTFQPHKLNHESPEGVWERWENLEFWDVESPAREIHFMHGSSCLVPKAALLELSAIDLPNREYILVDDYWLSYALSGILGWKIWKIDASGAFQFDKSAEDPEVALWLNPRVQHERTNFYVYHMQRGWPDGCSA